MLSIPEKKLYWQETEIACNKLTDGLGRPIDAGILETVIALNILDITTSQSCEGHLDHGRPYPWISISTPDAVKISRQAGLVFAQAAQQKEQEQSSDDILQPLYNQAQQLKSEAEKLHARDQQKLLNHLTKFYSVHHAPFDCQLILYTRISGTSHLESQGAATVIGQPLEIQKQKLRMYQKEMLAFTEFLKNIYFED